MNLMKQNNIIAIMTAFAILITLIIAISPTAYGLTLTASVPEATKDNKITITGTTDSGVQIEIILNQARIAQVTSDSQGNFATGKITLVHENNTIQVKATDSTGNVKVLMYNVDIDMKPPAVDYGQIPAGIQTRTLSISGTSSEPITLKYRLNNTINYTSLGQMGKTFTASIDMQDGMNNLELLAEDKAGNTDIQNFDISYDIVKPTFISTNLNNLEPCYFDFPMGLGKKVDITGKTSEKTSIMVYVNNDNTPSIGVSGDDGMFRIKDVKLTNKVKVQSNATQTSIEFGDKYENKVKVVARDLAGNEETIEQTITCATCGGGASGYTFTQGPLVPTSLSPKLLVQGMELITIPFNASYRGLNKAALGTIRATRPILAPDFAKDYDNDKISAPFVIMQKSKDKQSAVGVIQIQIPKFDPLGTAESDAASFRREENVSKYRINECGLGKAELQGCIKLFLTIEIPYQEQTTLTALDPNTLQTGNVQLEKKTQTICIAPLIIAIDLMIPEKYTPRKMVNEVIRWINSTLTAIEKIKTPIAETQKGLTYTCMGSIGVVTLNKLAELTTCTIGSAISGIGDAPWHEEIAEIGACDDVYAEEFDKEKDDGPGVEGNERARKACNSCSELKNTRKWLQYEVMNRVCDRVGCPTAKTFKKYIQEKGDADDITTTITDYFALVEKSASKDSPESKDMKKAVADKTEKVFKEQGINRKVYKGSDCGFVTNPKSKYITPTYDDRDEAKGIKTLYTLTSDGANRDKCVSYTRAAKPECCGIEYNREWSTACGLGQVSGSNIPLLDTFDELKESTCLSAQQAGKAQDMQCGVLWNALAGFCEPNTGKAVSDVVYTGISYQTMNADSYDNKAYIFIDPKETSSEVTNYEIWRGYSISTLKYKNNETKYKDKGAKELTQALYKVHDVQLTEFFQETAEKQETTFTKFKAKLCDGLTAGDEGCTDQRARNAYDRVKEAVGVSDKEYIVKPDSNILRSIQCLCIPAVRAWVEEWEKILTILKQCMTSVQTGKGDAGICDQFISQAVCDRVYDLIKCFTSKIGAPGAGKRVTGDMGIGAIVGLLSNTASEMSNTITSRYGETGMWSSLINEKQLVKGVCMWAFTGKWDMALDQVAEQSVEQQTPIASTSMLGECKKYFRGFSPVTQPTGLTNWVYECDAVLVAGANLNYKLKLQCSDDYSCKEDDGYRNKECDCVKKGKNFAIIEAGTLKQGDYLNKKITFMVQAGQGAGIRYDTAILEYEWENPQTKQAIIDTDTRRYITQAEGAEPFEYCSFDPFTFTFRCQFGQQDSGIKIEKVSAEYSKRHTTRTTKAFPMNDPFIFGVQVKQKMPETFAEQQAAKKYLYYKIWNHVGNLVEGYTPENGTANSFLFESNGDYTKPIEINLKQAKIEKNLKQKTGEKLIGWPKEGDNAVEPSEYIDSYSITQNKANSNALIALEGNEITVYVARTPTPGPDGFPKGPELVKELYRQGELKRIIKDAANNEYNIKINISKMPDTGRVEIYLPTKMTGTESPWNADTTADWKIEFTMYDSDKYGQPTSQITTSPDGEIQQKPLTFKVMKDAGEDANAPITAPGAAAAQTGAQAGQTGTAVGTQTAAVVPTQIASEETKYKLHPTDWAIMRNTAGEAQLVKILTIDPYNIMLLTYPSSIATPVPISQADQIVKLIVDEEWPISIPQPLWFGPTVGKVKIITLPTEQGAQNEMIYVQWLSRSDGQGLNAENIYASEFDINIKLTNVGAEIANKRTQDVLAALQTHK